jgi:hypothetical protein
MGIAEVAAAGAGSSGAPVPPRNISEKALGVPMKSFLIMFFK